MIEIIQKQDELQKETLKLPKNIRQIGSPKDDFRIYMEDYVYTYIHPTEKKERDDRKICILLGDVKKEENKYVFIYGAIGLEFFQETEEAPQFTEEVWSYIYKQMKEYFEGAEIVGWSIQTAYWPLHLMLEFEKLHRRYFDSNEKLMIFMENDDREEGIYRLQNGYLLRQTGYYVYYEKNKQMQEFMVRHFQEDGNSTKTEAISDAAIVNYRALLLEKQQKEHLPKGEHAIMCAAGVFTAMAACVIGISMINNYEKMKSMEQAIIVLSESVDTEEVFNTEGVMEIENVESSITKSQESGEVTPETNEEVGQLQQSQVSTTENQTTILQTDAGSETESQETLDVATQPLTEAETYRLQGYYIVQNGDSLASISEKIYGDRSKINEICTLNGIEDENLVYAGEKILLP